MAERPEVRDPYPGLRPFQRHEAEIFFGREQHVDRLLEILQREHFLAVIGPSGSGKSSLVRAGLLPALAAGWLGTGSHWRMAVLQPGDRPHRNLALALLAPTALGPALGSADDERSDAALIQAELGRGPLALVHLVDDAVQNGLVPETTQLLVLVDQFEEIFRYGGLGRAQADQADAFVSLLLAARAKGRGRIFVALTMRTDFLGNCVQFLELPDAINRAQYLTPRLTRDQLESAITGPARTFGGDVAPGIVNELINTVAEDPDQLPILQHALARMWDEASRRAPDGPEISRDDLDAIGGISGALSRHANAVLADLESRMPDARALTETLFRAITERGETSRRDTRRPTRLGLVAEASGCRWPELVPIVEAFAREGVNFLVHGRPLDGDAYVDISHEALIRQWTLLQGWVADEAERADGYRRWRGRAADRARRGGELLGGADLARALEWRAGTPAWQPTAAWARRYAADESTATVELDATLSYIAEGEQRQRAVREAEEAASRQRTELERRRMAAETQAAEARAETDRERAAAAVREQELAQASARTSRRLTRAAAVIAALAVVAFGAAMWSWHRATIATTLARAQALEAHARRALDRTGAGLELSLLLASESLRTVWTYDGYEAWVKAASLLPAREVIPSLRPEPITAMTVSADGRWVATASPAKSITIRRAADWSVVTVLSPESDADLLAFSPDGRWLAAGDGPELRLWRTSDWQPTASVKRPWERWEALVFNRSGTLLATAAREKVARVFPVNGDGTLGPEITRPELEGDGRVMAVAFAADGRWFALGGQAPGVRVFFPGDRGDLWKDVFASASRKPAAWDLRTGQLTWVLSALEGDRLLIGNPRGVELWTVRGASTMRSAFGPSDGYGSDAPERLDHAKPVRAISARDEWFAIGTGEGAVHVWNDSGVEIARTPPARLLHGERPGVGLLDGRQRLVTGGAEGITVWPLPASAASATARPGGSVQALAASADDRWLATGSADGATTVFSAPALRQVTVPPHPAAVSSLVFSPNGQWLAVAGGQTVRWLGAGDWKHAGDARFPEEIAALAFSPDSRWLAAIGHRGVHVATAPAAPGSPSIVSIPHEGMVERIAFSPDARFVATRTPRANQRTILVRPTTTRVFDRATGAEVAWKSHEKDLDAKFQRRSGEAPFAHEGGRAVLISDARQWKWVDLVPATLTSADGRWLIDGAGALSAPQNRARENLSLGSLVGFAFLEGGRWLVTAQSAGVSVWPLRPDDLRAETCRRVTRNLSREDWTRYVGRGYELTCPELAKP